VSGCHRLVSVLIAGVAAVIAVAILAISASRTTGGLDSNGWRCMTTVDSCDVVGSPATAHFSWRNPMNRTLTVGSVKTSCTCATVQLSRKQIQPYGELKGLAEVTCRNRSFVATATVEFLESDADLSLVIEVKGTAYLDATFESTGVGQDGSVSAIGRVFIGTHQVTGKDVQFCSKGFEIQVQGCSLEREGTCLKFALCVRQSRDGGIGRHQAIVDVKVLGNTLTRRLLLPSTHGQ